MNETTKTKPGLSTWLRVVFGVSLALNLLIVGLLVGTFMRFGGAEGRRPPPLTMGTAMFRELPREDRKALRENSETRGYHTTESRTAEADAIAAALRTSPFDKDAVQDVLDSQAEHRLNWQEMTQSAWLERVSQMSVKVRAEYADRLYKALTKRRDPDRHERGQKPKKED